MRSSSGSTLYQRLAIAFCIVFSLAMIINNQLGGEAMWFWYTTAFHQGVKLYSQLHLSLQPFYVLELDAWIHLAGIRSLPLEGLSLIHVFVMCAALYLILRESDWPDGLKALVLTCAFTLTVWGRAYRFDDYHVNAESFVYFGVLMLLLIARTPDVRRILIYSGVLGVFTACTITTRVTEGAALLASAAICLCFLAKRAKMLTLLVFLVATSLAVLLIVHLTGDTFSSYLANSVTHAAGNKGGTGSVFFAPVKLIINTVDLLKMRFRWRAIIAILVLLLSPVICRFSKVGYRSIILVEFAVFALLTAIAPHHMKVELLDGGLISGTVLLLTLVVYVLPLIVLYRMISAKRAGRPWDAREVLLIVPLAEWAAYSAASAGEPLTNVYAPIAILFLLVPIFVLPYDKGPTWWKPYFAGFLTIITVSAVVSKVMVPYSWQNYTYGPMFVNRQFYEHPVYGTLYINKDLLQFSEAVCTDIGSEPGRNAPELLSIPYPFPNYFCATPPWHNYVQTFFDTSTRATIEKLMLELNTAPPQYIVYQRQLDILTGAELLFNHGKPLAQRELDAMIFEKIASGQWTLIEKRDYLRGEGWYIIRTHP